MSVTVRVPPVFRTMTGGAVPGERRRRHRRRGARPPRGRPPGLQGQAARRPGRPGPLRERVRRRRRRALPGGPRRPRCPTAAPCRSCRPSPAADRRRSRPTGFRTDWASVSCWSRGLFPSYDPAPSSIITPGADRERRLPRGAIGRLRKQPARCFSGSGRSVARQAAVRQGASAASRCGRAERRLGRPVLAVLVGGEHPAEDLGVGDHRVGRGRAG